MPDFILEIGTEEIPAGFLPPALAEMKSRFERFLEDAALTSEGVETLGTPRRLVLIVKNVPARQEDREEEILGPPKSAAFAPDGTPTKAGLGFAKAKGVLVEDLGFKETPKGEYVCIRRRVEGKETVVLLAEFLPKFIVSIPFKKSMRWGESTLRFARPIHWILTLFDGKVIPFDLDGIAAGNRSFGHRFLAPEEFDVTGVASYLEGLRRHMVMVDPEERKVVIQKGIEEALSSRNLQWLEDPDLLEEVAYLVEYPFVVMGAFDETYLSLPQEVLVTAMREHQRYFSVMHPDDTLAPYFIAVNNTYRKELATFVKGHERVLRARLEDAKFFFEEDRKVPLEQRVEELKGVVFHAKLGTSYEKVRRIIQLSEYLAETLGTPKGPVLRTAHLCKADLVSEMVGEFPSLQGIMGRIYARLSGEPEEICEAIFEHYLPRFSEDKLPTGDIGAIVGMADRMDTIVGCFGDDLIPTGAADPFGLRRAALAIIRIILVKDYTISLSDWIDKARGLLSEKVHLEAQSAWEVVRDFFAVRFRGYLQAEGIAFDTIEAVIARNFDDIADSYRRVTVFHEFRQDPAFASLMLSFKRVVNILEGQNVEEKAEIRLDLLKEDPEKALYEKMEKIRGRFVTLMEKKDYHAALQLMATLKPVVDRFFDEVLVMDPDEAHRENRLTLLTRIQRLFSRFADFSKVSASL
jgi:glycyl-tRNA synthetase beta chain